MIKMTIQINDYLKVQHARAEGEKYIRVTIPAKIAESEDIRPGDLVRISILEHIKAGR